MNRLQPFKLERYFARHEFNTRYLMSSSDCESWSIDDLLRLEPAAAEQFHRQWLGYTESLGSLPLRQEICQIYSTISPDQVLVHSGAEEAILLFMHAALEPHDEIIVHVPCYQALLEIPRAIGCRVIPWVARENDHWALDLSELESKITSRTKAVVVNFPHNPTGFLPGKDFFGALSELTQARGVILFSDEVYRESEHDPQDRLPAACDINEKAVSIGVLSKTYGLAGLRIGWVATRNKKILARMAELKDYTTICNSAPSEFLACVALRHRQKLATRNLGTIHDNLVLLDGFFARNEDLLNWKRPKAGSIGFPGLVSSEADSFCQRAIELSQVLLLPGSVFGEYPRHFRMGFGRKNLPESLARFEHGLRR